MTVNQLYTQKLMTAKEAVHHIGPEEDLITPIMAGEPPLLLNELANSQNLKDNRLFQMLSPYGVLTLPENRLKTVSMFMGASERKAFQEGKIDLLPNHFSNVPDLLKEITRNHAVLAVVSPMDEKGYFSLGTNSDYVYEMSKTARTVLLEVNEYMPRTYGENQIHISDVTALVENHRPLPESPEMRISEKDEKIAGFVADLIQNGDTLQIGFGSIPGAIMNF